MTIRTLMLGAALGTSLVALGARIEATPNEATIPLDDVAAVWVKQHDDSWLYWIAGAPDFVNRPFAEQYAAQVVPAPVSATGPVTIGWWRVESDDNVTTATLVDDRTSGGRRHAMTLHLVCEGQQISVAIGFDQNNRGVPREIDPDLYDGRTGKRRGGQVYLTFEVKVSGERREPYIRGWWDLTPDYRWAHAPEPTAVIDYLRGGDSLVVHTRELTGFAGFAEPPLRGVDEALDALPCVSER